MLLDFKIKNYKSFYNLTDISMIADSAKKDFNIAKTVLEF